MPSSKRETFTTRTSKLAIKAAAAAERAEAAAAAEKAKADAAAQRAEVAATAAAQEAEAAAAAREAKAAAAAAAAQEKAAASQRRMEERAAAKEAKRRTPDVEAAAPDTTLGALLGSPITPIVADRATAKALQKYAREAARPGKAGASARAPRLTPRGYKGAGNGRVSYVEAPPEWRGTTVQACGMFPWAVGGSTPTLGVPLGPHLRTGTTVCFDPINWFERGRFIPNPSYFTLGLPGLGKSTFTRRQVLGLAGMGVRPLVLGDLKPDYADLIAAIGGQVVKLGRGLGALNVLDVGAIDEAAAKLPPEDAERLRSEAHGRRLNVVTGLILIVRGTPVADYERAVLSAALQVLLARHDGVPTLVDLVKLLDEGPPQVRAVTLDRGDEDRYRDVVDPLHRSLLALLDGPLGDTFSRPTTHRIALDSPGVAIDVSGISSSDTALQAAVLLACWSDGFGAVEAANALADAGVGPQRHYFVVLDELWRVLRSGVGMVDNVDALTRLNRTQGVAMAQITHTMSDLRALSNSEDIAKAKGFVERAGALVCGGLPPQELDELQEIVHFTRAERDLITSWSTPPSWDERSAPPGQGNFLIKVGRRPGVPLHLDLTSVERNVGVHDTNRRWSTAQRRPAGATAATAAELAALGGQTLVRPETATLPSPRPSFRKEQR